MASPLREEFLLLLEREFGHLQRMGTSTSLFAIRDKARVYLRYSKVHSPGSTFFGLGQLRNAVLGEEEPAPTNFSQHQMQTIVASIGILTGHAVYIPRNDRPFMDWAMVDQFDLADDAPSTGRHAPAASLRLIDVLWIQPTQNSLAAAFEIEHSTPIYSGLLRFNDVHIDFKLPRAGIIADAEREEAFLRQINRRTFFASGLNRVCLFYKYSDVYRWYLRVRSESHH